MDLCICWWCYIYFLQEVPVSCQNQEQLHHFCTLPVSAAPKWFTCYLRDVTPDNFVVSHLFYVFYLSFLCAHTPLPCPVTLLSVLPLSAHTSILCSSSSHSQFLSLILSPFAPSAWPIRITRSHKHSSSCFLLCSLVSPFFPIFLSVSLWHALSLLLYHWNSVSVFLHLWFYLWFLLQAHTFHIRTLLPSPFKFKLLDVSVLFPRQKCVPRCCVPEVAVEVVRAGTREMCWTSHAHTDEM